MQRFSGVLAAALAFGVLASSVAQADVVKRGATITVTGRIHKGSHLALPVKCEVSVRQNNQNVSNYENYTTVAEFKGNDGSCTVSIPFYWNYADDSEPVQVSVSVQSSYSNDNQAPGPRSSSFSFPDVPLPAPGSTTNLSFAVLF